VLVGHVDTRDRAAVFSRLHELRPGERVEIQRMREALHGELAPGGD
jgi:hypothetical protein